MPTGSDEAASSGKHSSLAPILLALITTLPPIAQAQYGYTTSELIAACSVAPYSSLIFFTEYAPAVWFCEDAYPLPTGSENPYAARNVAAPRGRTAAEGPSITLKRSVSWDVERIAKVVRRQDTFATVTITSDDVEDFAIDDQVGSSDSSTLNANNANDPALTDTITAPPPLPEPTEPPETSSSSSSCGTICQNWASYTTKGEDFMTTLCYCMLRPQNATAATTTRHMPVTPPHTSEYTTASFWSLGTTEWSSTPLHTIGTVGLSFATPGYTLDTRIASRIRMTSSGVVSRTGSGTTTAAMQYGRRQNQSPKTTRMSSSLSATKSTTTGVPLMPTDEIHYPPSADFATTTPEFITIDPSSEVDSGTTTNRQSGTTSPTANTADLSNTSPTAKAKTTNLSSTLSSTLVNCTSGTPSLSTSSSTPIATTTIKIPSSQSQPPPSTSPTSTSPSPGPSPHNPPPNPPLNLTCQHLHLTPPLPPSNCQYGLFCRHRFSNPYPEASSRALSLGECALRAARGRWGAFTFNEVLRVCFLWQPGIQRRGEGGGGGVRERAMEGTSGRGRGWRREDAGDEDGVMGVGTRTDIEEGKEDEVEKKWWARALKEFQKTEAESGEEDGDNEEGAMSLDSSSSSTSSSAMSAITTPATTSSRIRTLSTLPTTTSAFAHGEVHGSLPGNGTSGLDAEFGPGVLQDDEEAVSGLLQGVCVQVEGG